MKSNTIKEHMKFRSNLINDVSMIPSPNMKDNPFEVNSIVERPIEEDGVVFDTSNVEPATTLPTEIKEEPYVSD